MNMVRNNRKPRQQVITIPDIAAEPTICRIAQFLQGKRVIFVGPAAYLQGQGLGPWIDSFDIVVRANRSRPMAADYGSRTDILFHFMTELWSDYFIGNKGFKEDGIQATVITTGNDEIYKQYKASLPIGIFSATVPVQDYQAIKAEIGSKPNTGTVAIATLMKMDLKSLHVVGVDLYDTAYYKGYGGDLAKGSHDFEIQAAYLGMLVCHDKKTTLDANLKRRISGVLTIKDTPIENPLPAMSLLVPYKSDGGHRDKIFNFSMERYKKLFPEFEICIGENNEEPFNRAKAKNAAAAKATKDIFCIVDADAFFDREFVFAGLEAMKKAGWTRAGGRSIRISEQSTYELLDSEISVQDIEVQCDGFYSSNFFALIPRHQFEKIGGFDEDFRSWGGEDFSFYRTLRVYFGKEQSTLGRIFHIWHEWSDGAAKHMGALKTKNPNASETAARHMMYQAARTIDDILDIRRMKDDSNCANETNI